MTERFIIMLHRGRADFREQMRRSYQHFFITFAETLGFLLFFWVLVVLITGGLVTFIKIKH